MRPTLTGLSRGKGRTERPRVYAGCLPCGQGRWVADLEHANIWIATHWQRCRSFGSGLRGVEKPLEALSGKGKP
jgi:hypothetical protein